MGRLIAAQTLIGVGFASVPLAYSVPSEILPRKWRPSTYFESPLPQVLSANYTFPSHPSLYQHRSGLWCNFRPLDNRRPDEKQSSHGMA